MAPDAAVVSEATEALASDGAPAEAAAAEAKADTPATPELVEVWRPGGRSEERRPRHDRNRHRHHDRPQHAARSAPPLPQPAKPARRRRASSGIAAAARHNDFRKPRRMRRPKPPRRRAAEGAPARETLTTQGNRPPRERFEGKGRDENAATRQGQIRRRPQQGQSRRSRQGAAISAGATRAAATSATAARRTANTRPAPRRANVTGRSIPIRRLQNWRR